MAETSPQATSTRPVIQPGTEPLAALRDIHQPEPVADGLPAPGWWLLTLLLLIALWSLCRRLIARRRASRYRREARAELATLLATWQQQHDDRAYLAALQQLLKRVALTSFPRENVASLTGEGWVTFLDQSVGNRSSDNPYLDKYEFSTGVGEILIDGNYNPAATFDVESLHLLAERWIKQHHPRHLALPQTATAPSPATSPEASPKAPAGGSASADRGMTA